MDPGPPFGGASSGRQQGKVGKNCPKSEMMQRQPVPATATCTIQFRASVTQVVTHGTQSQDANHSSNDQSSILDRLQQAPGYSRAQRWKPWLPSLLFTVETWLPLIPALTGLCVAGSGRQMKPLSRPWHSTEPNSPPTAASTALVHGNLNRLNATRRYSALRRWLQRPGLNVSVLS